MADPRPPERCSVGCVPGREPEADAGARSSRWSSSSSRCSPATSPARAAARSSTRPRSCASGSRVEQAVGAVEECGAPMVSIAGGEPLLHPDIGEMVAELSTASASSTCAPTPCCCAASSTCSRRRRYFAFTVHVDGLRERHDDAVDRAGVFDEAVAAIREAKAARLPGHHQLDVLHHRQPRDGARRARLPQRRARGRRDDDLARPTPTRRRPTRSTSSASTQTQRLFREAFADGRRRRWRLNHTPLFLDFLEGKVDFQCTAWGIPSYSVFGWQRPCYLMADGYVATYRELVETTDWERYGRGRTRAAPTAWPTAATSRRRSSPRCRR